MLNTLNVFILIIISTTIANATPHCYTKQIAENISQLYMSVTPGASEQEFRGLVVASKDVLTANSITIVCMNRLGKQLIEKGTSIYDPRAYEKVMGVDSIQSASDVARSINSNALYLHYLGKQLQWLSSILPSASTGDFKSFEIGNIERNNIIQEYNYRMNSIKKIGPEYLEDAIKQQNKARILGKKQVYMLSLMIK